MGEYEPGHRDPGSKDRDMRMRLDLRESLVLCCAGFLALGTARASEALLPGLYEITTEISMPHLDENLRYATQRERRCVVRSDLAAAFPVLGEPGLRHCELQPGSADEASPSYILRCSGDTSITGNAQWELKREIAVGALAVRLGGKNMTFTQRVTAKRVGECE